MGWTAEQDAVLRERYAQDGAAAVASQVGMTVHAVHLRARRMGVKALPRWTAKENEKLRMGWGEVPLPELAAQLGRAVDATFRHGVKLGLRAGCPPHREYLQDAADRTGFHRTALRAILRWARVPTLPAVTHPSSHPVVRTTVDPFEVDEAIKRWLRMETMEDAARRTGVSSKRLRQALSRLACPPKKRGNRRTRWRLKPEVIDAALAASLTREAA